MWLTDILDNLDILVVSVVVFVVLLWRRRTLPHKVALVVLGLALGSAAARTRKAFEAERHPTRKRNRNREQEYDDLGIEHETHGLD
jgi:hypothetical protein